MEIQQDKTRFLARSSLVMKVIGWGFFPLTLPILFLFPEGFLWGIHNETQWSPYLFMMLGLYLAWCILLVREADNPIGAVLLFDWGILANAFHALIMLVEAVVLDHEMVHLWGDVPALLIVVLVLWRFSPRRLNIPAASNPDI